jgi:predicted polyphosphate/ATP-dependent NAD kinase
MKTPASVTRLQGGKMSVRGDMDSVHGIARYINETIDQDTLYIMGPGGTTAEIMKQMDLPNTLLGVDLVFNRRILANDVGISDILQQLDLIERAKIIVTPIGGQGNLFGRGNQQVGAPVIRCVGKSDIVVVATQAKLNSFYGKHLITDTGDTDLDEELSGYIRVVTGYRRETVFRIGC